MYGLETVVKIVTTDLKEVDCHLYEINLDIKKMRELKLKDILDEKRWGKSLDNFSIEGEILYLKEDYVCVYGGYESETPNQFVLKLCSYKDIKLTKKQNRTNKLNTILNI